MTTVNEKSTRGLIRSVGFEFNKPVASSDINEMQTIIINNFANYISGKLSASTASISISDFTDGGSTGITVTGLRYYVKDANSKIFFGYVDGSIVLDYPTTAVAGSAYDIYAYWRSIALDPTSTVYLNGIRANASQSSIQETTTTNNIMDTGLGEEVSDRPALELTFVVVAHEGTAPTLSDWSTGIKISEITIGDGVVANLVNEDNTIVTVEQFAEIADSLTNHEASIANSVDGIHGMKYSSGSLYIWDDTEQDWVEFTSGGVPEVDDTTIVINSSNKLAVNEFTGTTAQAKAALSTLPNGATIYTTD